MNQINLQVTADFEKSLSILQKHRHIKSKSEAIRVAVIEAAQKALAGKKTTDFHSWIGLALKTAPRSLPKLSDEDALWGE